MLEANKLGEKIFADVNNRLDKAGFMMCGGAIVDASLLDAPKSTKNKDSKRDSEMHQTKKGNEWYFGIKAYASVDTGSGYVDAITDTSANMHDVSKTANLFREDDEVVYGDSRYTGAVNKPAIKEYEKKYKIEFRVNKRSSNLKMAGNFKGINRNRKM